MLAVAVIIVYHDLFIVVLEIVVHFRMSVFGIRARLDTDYAGCDARYLQLTGDCFSLSHTSPGPPTTTAIHASCECLEHSV